MLGLVILASARMFLTVKSLCSFGVHRVQSLRFKVKDKKLACKFEP